MNNSEENEYDKIFQWKIRNLDGLIITVTGSFAEIEYKYFEGFNLPFKIDSFGNIEPFEVAYKRMKDYYKTPYKDRIKNN